jgi:uncharacterized membrane protein YphA (DoxX/SURF4 family)
MAGSEGHMPFDVEWPRVKKNGTEWIGHFAVMAACQPKMPNRVLLGRQLGKDVGMALSRRIARPLLASMFIAGGVDAVRHPTGKVKAAEAVTGLVSQRVRAIPNDPELLVRVNGAVQVGAGILLATGKFRRLAAVALISSIIPTTYAGHRFWEETEPAARAEQRTHFLKNLGLLGGLLLAAMDTEGEPSLSWRAKRRARNVGTAVAVGRAVTAATAHDTLADAARLGSRAARKARRRGAGQVGSGLVAGRVVGSKGLDVARHAGEGAAAVTRSAGSAAVTAAQVAPVVASATRKAALAAATAAQEATPVVLSATRAGAQLAAPYVATGADLAVGLLSKVSDHLPVD